MVRRHFVLRVAAIAGVLLLLAACQENGSSDDPSAEGLQGDAITIGATLPQTGIYSGFGRFYEEAFRYWEEQINSGDGLLGRPVRLVIYDDASDAGTAANLYQRLLTQDQVDLLVGGFPTPTLIPVLEIAERNQRVLIQGGANATPLIRESSYDYVFTTITGSHIYADQFLDYLGSIPEDERPERMAFVQQVNPFLQDVVSQAVPVVEELGIEIVANETFSDDSQDFTSMVQRFRQQNVDAVWVSNNVPAAQSLIRTLAEQEVDPKLLYVTAGPTLPPWVEDLGRATDGVFSSTPYWHSLEEGGNAEFVAGIEEEYGYVATRESGLAYTVLQVLQQAVEGAQSLEDEDLREYLNNNSFDTVGGNVEFDEYGMTGSPAHVMQVQGEDRVLVWPQDLQEVEPVYPRQ